MYCSNALLRLLWLFLLEPTSQGYFYLPEDLIRSLVHLQLCVPYQEYKLYSSLRRYVVCCYCCVFVRLRLHKQIYLPKQFLPDVVPCGKKKTRKYSLLVVTRVSNSVLNCA